MLSPNVGSKLFRRVQMELQSWGAPGMRGVEMMQGQEREMLGEAVWGGGWEREYEEDGKGRGVSVVLGPGDAVFIPQGWWHSVRSLGRGVNGSANWWFR